MIHTCVYCTHKWVEEMQRPHCPNCLREPPTFSIEDYRIIARLAHGETVTVVNEEFVLFLKARGIYRILEYREGVYKAQRKK